MPAPTDPSISTVNASGMLLVCHRPKRQFLLLKHPHRWDLPKGHCDEGESFLETAIRETEEETGIPRAEIQLDDQFVFETSYPVQYRKTGQRVFQKTVRYFLGYLESIPEITLTEHIGFQWFDWQPPHQIQSETIDPLLEAVDAHWRAARTRDS
jgi:8-oxo-dGTP pyrophosphatase MutT (NUDIX family)